MEPFIQKNLKEEDFIYVKRLCDQLPDDIAVYIYCEEQRDAYFLIVNQQFKEKILQLIMDAINLYDGLKKAGATEELACSAYNTVIPQIPISIENVEFSEDVDPSSSISILEQIVRYIPEFMHGLNDPCYQSWFDGI